MDTRRFPHGCVASPHHLASSVGAAVLSGGGNAIDAAVATNLALGVLTPYHCGPGGDLLAIVWDGDGIHAIESVGAAPSGATFEAVTAAAVSQSEGAGDGDGAPDFPPHGGLPITPPGAVAGWFTLLERFGSRSFGELVAPARRLARDGFVPSRHGFGFLERARASLSRFPAWDRRYGQLAEGEPLVQSGLADLWELLADQGPDALYSGPVAADIAAAVHAAGGFLTAEDLAAHALRDVTPLRTAFRDVEVLELPPPTQGMTAIQGLGVYDELGAPSDDPVVRIHRQIESVRAAMADRDRYLADPAAMPVPAEELVARSRLTEIARAIDDEKAASWPVATPQVGGTAYLCAADSDGRMISLIQSNFRGFGSGVHVERWGLNLHDRGSGFVLTPGHPNAVAPGKRPLHTLIPSMLLVDGRPEMVFGTMGGDGQPQTHLQLLARWVDHDEGLQEAIDAPRFFVVPPDGSVLVEDRVGAGVIEGLRARGHTVHVAGPYDHVMGHAHAIRRHPSGGYDAACETRTESAVAGG